MIAELCLLFFLVALAYSAAGFGGGSSYLAMLALWSVDFQLMKSTALICNVAVVIGGVYHFYRSGHLPLKKAWQLSLISVPLAFIGSYLPMKQATFFLLLGVALTLAALVMCYRLFFEREEPIIPANRGNGVVYGVIGGAIGLLSGMTGIGGGIYLSPVLRLGKYDTAKNIAGLSSFFILVNSIAGLCGQAAKHAIVFDWKFTGPLLMAVILGGQIGARLSAKVLKPRWVAGATAVLILYAGVRMLIK
ncbi:sulfite exporter TauE/SafE family protein [Chitinophaga polysaccharea]|uniref:sulfite exporter TauE/SafE family protein n=1 Tax=Chitinophaga TaxID=79328 RepID=UPI001454E7CC|nr:sulfite exporter TauE/SafE family protein [Chitinophaga sp. Ak27]NLR61687.1 sulfite exporter TauE/SafE family protein [Chitinophaga polysaccharea]NLU93718.1 sulfite exporter TauE/SafE family protein [Chitinophaga sp. Ak27]